MSKITEMLDEFSDKMSAHAMLFLGVPLGILFLMFILCLLPTKLFCMPMLFVQLILVCAMLFFYVLFVGKFDDKQKKTGKLLLKIAIMELAAFSIGAPVLRVARNMESAAVASTGIILAATAALVCLAVFMMDFGKKAFEKLDSVFSSGGRYAKKELHPGDVVLCDIMEEMEEGVRDPREIIPHKDRYLHMLILGPTGCGKTSQVIIPMVRQDIQNLECGVTVLEPKGDLAIKAAMMAKYYGRDFIYFDPSYRNCPKFNPLSGREVDVVENMATTFKMLNPDSPQFFLDLNEQLIRNAVKVLKRLDRDERVDGKYATLNNLSRLLQNSGGTGREMVNKFAKIVAPTDSEAKENADIASWFLNDYFPERSKVYENTSGVRSQVAKLISNEYLREVLNPDYEKGEHNEINFDKHLAEGGVICISTAQGALRDLSKYLGYFIILSLQSAVFRRPGTENTRRAHMLYIDEFQTYSTPGFSDMLTQGRSYRVGSILATQARAQMAMGGGKDGKNFVELVSANARNVVLFPGLNKDDAKYYSEQFGETEKTEVMVGYSEKVFSPIKGGLSPLGHPQKSVREQKKMQANFSPTDLIFSQTPGEGFGKITYCIIKNNSPQPAKVGKISYIPRELNNQLDEMIDEYMKMYARESAAEYYQHEGEAQEQQEQDDGLHFADMLDDEMAANGVEDLGAGEDLFATSDAPQGGQSDVWDGLRHQTVDENAPIDWGAEEEVAPQAAVSMDFEVLDDSGDIFDGSPFGDDDDYI